VRDRFLHGEAAQIALAGLSPKVNRFFVLSGAFELLRDQFRGRFNDLREALLQHRGNGGMKLLPPGP
jgi:hypothetical protein